MPYAVSFVPLIFCLFVTSCATLKPAAFKSEVPPLEPMKFFQGHIRSYGVRENRSGKPGIITTTDIKGVYRGGVLYLEQDLMAGGKANHRSWQLRQLDANHVQATADDIKGSTVGILYGNYFTWHYSLKIASIGLFRKVSMTQYMYLLPDGRTVIIRSVIRKLGFIVQEITEGFRRVEE